MRKTLRMIEIVNPPQHVTIIGCGATGSWLALMLAKAGVEKLTLVDFDAVEEHNIGTSIYGYTDLGRPKVEALKDHLTPHRVEVEAIDDEFKAEYIGEINAMCVDNMEARAKIHRAAKTKGVKYVVDLRQHWPYITVIGYNPNLHSKLYEATLFPDERAWRGTCTAQATPYLSATTASIAAHILLTQRSWLTFRRVDASITAMFKGVMG